MLVECLCLPWFKLRLLWFMLVVVSFSVASWFVCGCLVLDFGLVCVFVFECWFVGLCLAGTFCVCLGVYGCRLFLWVWCGFWFAVWIALRAV